MRTKDVEAVEFALLFRRFEDEYGDAYVRLIAELRESYPEITRRGRRTGRALRNICFFAWSACRECDRKLIPTLVRAAVLLSAQDDYYDNPRIPASQKESFCAATNRALRTNSFRWNVGRGRQLRDLASLWSYVARTIPRNASRVRSYWVEAACRLNDAMAAEIRTGRNEKITYEEYMGTAIYSIGMVFVWATCLAHEHVPMTTLRRLDPILVRGARVVRLSNDLASYRQRRKRASSVTLVGGRSPAAVIRRIVAQEAQVFRHGVETLDVRPDIRCMLTHSMDFLREFYQRSDFDRPPFWQDA